MLRVALIPQGVIKSWRRQAFMHSKRKIPYSWRTGWKAKACTSFVLYLKVFKNHLHYLWHVRVLSPDLLNHVYIHSFRSIIKATEKFPGGGGIWSPGMDLWWGIWIAFRPREWGIWTKIFQKFKCPGGCLGGGMLKLRFDWYITLTTNAKKKTSKKRSGKSKIINHSLDGWTIISKSSKFLFEIKIQDRQWSRYM